MCSATCQNSYPPTKSQAYWPPSLPIPQPSEGPGNFSPRSDSPETFPIYLEDSRERLAFPLLKEQGHAS